MRPFIATTTKKVKRVVLRTQSNVKSVVLDNVVNGPAEFILDAHANHERVHELSTIPLKIVVSDNTSLEYAIVRIAHQVSRPVYNRRSKLGRLDVVLHVVVRKRYVKSTHYCKVTAQLLWYERAPTVHQIIRV